MILMPNIAHLSIETVVNVAFITMSSILKITFISTLHQYHTAQTPISNIPMLSAKCCYHDAIPSVAMINYVSDIATMITPHVAMTLKLLQ